MNTETETPPPNSTHPQDDTKEANMVWSGVWEVGQWLPTPCLGDCPENAWIKTGQIHRSQKPGRSGPKEGTASLAMQGWWQ